MDSTNKSKWRVRGAAVVIFVLGFAAGSLALNVYKRWARPADSRQSRFERMIDTPVERDQKRSASNSGRTRRNSKPSKRI